jgi:NAD(P)H-hydrate epimerase
MEQAGTRVTQAILQNLGKAAKKGVLVVAGKGNNGGDGFVAARLLVKKRIPCEVVLLAKREELSADAAHNLRAYLKLKGKVTDAPGPGVEILGRLMAGKGLVVDAILGTGVKNEVSGLYAQAITLINGAALPIVAVDIASGLDADTGRPLGIAVRAAMTVALGYAKIGQVIYPGIDYSGELIVVDIGIDPRATAEVAPKTELLEREEVKRLVPVRQPNTHKGTYGHVLIMAGSRGKTGAAILAARAAMRAGAGLATLAAARSLNNILASALVEVMTEPLKDSPGEEVEPLADDEWRALLERKDAFLFGPGIGVNDSTRSNLRWLLRNLDLPWVIDADGLNNLALELDRLRNAKTAPILTPHPGEMGRLLGKESAVANRDRVASARSFATKHRCHMVLKGARTVIATAEGRVFINPTGNPGMASGGMGDVLGGMLVALLGQGLSPENAMKLGVYLHGFAGDRHATENGEIGLIASDIIENLPSSMRQLGGG